LLLALAAFHGPHLLVLDEPTNHLDVDAREALVRALNDYAGAVIIISHDRHLIDACADRLWIVHGGRVLPYDGDIDQYRAQCLAERGADPTARPAKAETAARPTAQAGRRQAAHARAELAPLRKRVATAETEIERLTRRIGAIDRDLADGALYLSNPAEAQALARERGGLIRSRVEAEALWLAASEAYERAKARDQPGLPSPQPS
jgi:ATP-binding cassette subfamily F protein 3